MIYWCLAVVNPLKATTCRRVAEKHRAADVKLQVSEGESSRVLGPEYCIH